ncbi:MAG TPA: serine/threonine-protein kinase [Actinomycetota bacterium]|nr:serine/threonine-protein kinase [Actinomycetota bacterium]
MTTAPSWELAEGDEIAPERWALQLLGGGRKYEAYLAYDEELQSTVVAKLLRPHVVEDEGARETMTAEGAALTSLNHPVLLRCFGVVEGPRPHLVLEHLEGPRLSTLLRRQRKLAIEQVVMLGLQLTSALHYMHRREIVHLDVKPKNIIMSGPPRLIDLSVARSFDRARRATEPIGTDAYMAPEQCEPRLMGGMGAEADVWGWGVTMFEAITGLLPWPKMESSTSREERFPQLHLDPAPLGGDTPPLLAALVMGCLEKRPENRPRQSDIAGILEPLVAALPRRIVFTRFRPRMR